eukprot:jgi/Mesvir1/26493/Mv25097-RA.1
MLLIVLPLCLLVLHAGGYAEGKTGYPDPGAISIKSAHLCSTSADLRSHLDHFIAAPKDLSEQELLLAKRQFLRRVQCSPPSTLDDVGSSASARAISPEFNEDIAPDQIERPRRLYLAIQLLKKELQRRQRTGKDMPSCYCDLPSSLKHKRKVASAAWERWYRVEPPAGLKGVPGKVLGRASTLRHEKIDPAFTDYDEYGDSDDDMTRGSRHLAGTDQGRNATGSDGHGSTTSRNQGRGVTQGNGPPKGAALMDTVGDGPRRPPEDVQLEMDTSEDPHQAVLQPGPRDAGWYGLAPRALFRKVVEANRWLANLTAPVAVATKGVFLNRGNGAASLDRGDGLVTPRLGGGRDMGGKGGQGEAAPAMRDHAALATSVLDGDGGRSSGANATGEASRPRAPTIVVVGSSGALLLGRPPFGERIDSYTEVVRFNGKFFPGRERHTGMRTTIEVVGGFGGTCGCPLGHCCDAHAAQQFWLRVGFPRLILKASPYGLTGAKEVWKRTPSVTQQARLFYPGDPETANAVINAWLRFMREEKGLAQLRTRLPKVHRSRSAQRHHHHGTREASTGLRMVVMLLMGGVRKPAIVGFDLGDSQRPHYFHGKGVARVRGKGAVVSPDARILEELALAGLLDQLT